MGRTLAPIDGKQLGQAKVSHFGQETIFGDGEQDVGGLEVAMNQTQLVGTRYAAKNALGQEHRLLEAQSMCVQQNLESGTIDVFHHQAWRIFHLHHIGYGHDVGMPEDGLHSPFLEKSLANAVCGQAKHLYCMHCSQGSVAGPIDNGHATFADNRLDRVVSYTIPWRDHGGTTIKRTPPHQRWPPTRLLRPKRRLLGPFGCSLVAGHRARPSAR